MATTVMSATSTVTATRRQGERHESMERLDLLLPSVEHLVLESLLLRVIWHLEQLGQAAACE
jgi:hypothetical protein